MKKCPSCKDGSLIEVVRTVMDSFCKVCEKPITVECEHDGYIFTVVSPPCSNCGYQIEREDAHDYWGMTEKIVAVMCDECEYTKEF